MNIQFDLSKIFLRAMLLTMLIVALIGMVGCSVTRDIKKETSSFDSSYTKLVEDSNRLLKNENELLKKTIAQKEKSEIVFEDKICPPCPSLPIIPAELDLLNKDSVNRLIHDLNDLITFQNNYINNQDNTIKKYADGTIEYKGRIKSYSLANELLQDELSKKEAMLEAVSNSKANEAATVAITTTSLDKKTKTSFFDFWQYIIPIAFVMFVVGALVQKRYKILNVFG